MGNPTAIERQSKIGIGTYPVFGSNNMLGDVQALSADWFYTWMPNVHKGAAYGWTAGSGVDLTEKTGDTAFSLGGQGGWAYQDLQLSAGQPWFFVFEGQALSGSAGVVLDFKDSQGSTLATEWVEVGAVDQRYALTGSTPEGAASVRVVAYAEDGSSAQFDDFRLYADGGNLIVNGDIDALAGAQIAPGFVPMVWGRADMAELASLAAATPGGPLLTFNEPDHAKQSNMSVEQALSLWPELMASGMRLSSPAVTTSNTLRTGGWLDQFMSGAKARGYDVDFMAVHYYTTNPDVGAFKSFLDRTYAKYGKPIWVTEWSLADWSNEGRFSAAEQQAFFEAGTRMMDDLPYVERQAWFSAYSGLDGLQLNTGLFDPSGLITPLGNSFALLAQDPAQAEPVVNMIVGGSSEGKYVGSLGIDTVDFSAKSTAIFAHLSGGNFSAVENLVGGSGADRLWGDDHANELVGGLGNDRLYGEAGNDVLTGGEGADRLDGGLGQDTISGGAGSDSYVVDNIADVVNETNEWGADAGGIDTVTTSVSLTLAGLAGFVENLTLAGDWDIDGIGNALSNTITGNSGRNVLDGRAGNDTLKGWAGGDVLIGGLGNDQLFGGDGNDRLVGGEGADRLDGGHGQDSMHGGAGNDSYYVDDRGDIVDETGQWGADAGGTDTVTSSVSFALTGSALFVERLKLIGSPDVDGRGNELNNTLIGNDGKNVLDGRAGQDTLAGGAGEDTLIGGSGNDRLHGGEDGDRFVFEQHFGRDTILDFQADGADNDVLHLSLGAAFDTFEEVFAASKQVGSNTVITLGNDGAITLANLSLDTLTPADLTFA